jgi:hypothetical protein
MTGALLWVPLVAVVLFAMWLMAEHVLAAGAEWERVQGLFSAWSVPGTAGEAAAGLSMLEPGPFPAVSTLPGCDCPVCECARLLEMDGGRS